MGKRLPEHLEDEQMRQARLAKEQRQLENRPILVNEIVEIKPEEPAKEESIQEEIMKEEPQEQQETQEESIGVEEEKVVKIEHKKKKKKRGRPSRRDY